MLAPISLLLSKARQDLAQLGIGLAHHLLQGRVHVHDVVVVVGHHHVRPDHVERRAHPQIDDLLGNRLLEHLGRLGDVADFVAARGVRHVDDAVIGQLDQHAGHLAERLDNADRAEHGRTDQHQNDDRAYAKNKAAAGGHFLRGFRRAGIHAFDHGGRNFIDRLFQLRGDGQSAFAGNVDCLLIESGNPVSRLGRPRAALRPLGLKREHLCLDRDDFLGAVLRTDR